MAFSHDNWDPTWAADTCRRMLVLYGALNAEAAPNSGHWRLKPKCHMVQEMIEYQSFFLGNPRLFWCYEDEDFVGWCATISHSRGGGGSWFQYGNGEAAAKV